MKKVYVILIAIFLLVLSFWWLIVSPMSYIRSTTGFNCFFAYEIYSYDAIDHGKDYDNIRIIRLSSLDQHRIYNYLENKKEWNSLPIPDYIRKDRLCSIQYDVNIDQMLRTENGFWFYNEGHQLNIYDIEKGLLYIRKASVIL